MTDTTTSSRTTSQSPTTQSEEAGAIGRPLGYDEADQCRACGEHISDPHAAGCPAETAAQLRQDAEQAEEAHSATVAAGGYTSGVCLTLVMGDEPTEVSHRFLAAAQRVAADLIEADHIETVNLDAWPAAAEFVAYLTGEADPWNV